MPTADTALLALAWILVAVGVVGSVLPAIPGVPVLFGGLLLAAWVEGFTYVGPGALTGLAVLGALGYGIDFAAGALGARHFGASKRAVLGASSGALVGLFFGLPGILLGPFLGAVLGEISAQRGLPEAGRAGIGAVLGLAVGAAAKLAISLTMVGVYLVLRYF